MDQAYRDLPPVPAVDIVLVIDLRVLDAKPAQPLRYTVKIMLEPVCNKERFSLLGFDDVFKRIQLSVVDNFGSSFVRINGTIRHLGELSRQGCRVACCHLAVRKAKDKLFFHLVVDLLFLRIHPDFIGRTDQLRHAQDIRTANRNCHISDPPVNLLLCSGQRLITVHDHTVGLVRAEVCGTIRSDKFPQPFAEIQQSVLCPKIHKTVTAGGTCQANDAPNLWPDFQ